MSNLGKISGPANLDFFSRCPKRCRKKIWFYHQPEKKSRWQTEKKSKCAGPEIFLTFETNLNSWRPWFSEIKAQIKEPTVSLKLCFSSRCSNSLKTLPASIYLSSRVELSQELLTCVRHSSRKPALVQRNFHPSKNYFNNHKIVDQLKVQSFMMIQIGVKSQNFRRTD